MRNADRIAAYAYRYWSRAKMEEWPTIRMAARALRLRQVDIEECEGDGTFILTAYNVGGGTPLGDHFIEAETPEVERDWAAYWAPFRPIIHPFFGAGK